MFDLNGRSALVIGHADGDGHIAAEQSRRNLISANARNCDVLVRPGLTSSFRFWEKSLNTVDLGSAEVVVFVDIALNPHNPKRSLEAVFDRANSERDRMFLLIDHHPVNRLPRAPENVFINLTSTVFTCCYGLPSNLMIVAAICDKDELPVKHLIQPMHRKRALGISRGAADKHGLAGKQLLALLQADRWDLIEKLAEEPKTLHKRVRGNRLLTLRPSSGLIAARLAAA